MHHILSSRAAGHCVRLSQEISRSPSHSRFLTASFLKIGLSADIYRKSSRNFYSTFAMNTTQVEITLDQIKQIIPPLAEHRYKGQAGKIAIIGGCREYTGAPFFASYSALKVGADLSHVFCTPSAATVIKTYSPELIVHPYLPETTSSFESLTSNPLNEKDINRTLNLSHDYNNTTLQQWSHVIQRSTDAVSAWLDRFDALVVGPGLGRDGVILHTVKCILEKAIKKNIPLIIDADGLWLINKEIELIQGYNNAILTPNIAEFRRLASALNLTVQHEDDWFKEEILADIVMQLGGPTVVRKGHTDLICGYRPAGTRDGSVVMAACKEEGSMRRVGGQGDVLCGTIAAFFSWCNASPGVNANGTGVPVAVLAAYGGCFTTRRASRLAFSKHGRAMGATDVMAELGRTVDRGLS